MIKILAILVESGRAFIEENGAVYHFAPPYTFDARIDAVQDDIEEAISGYGFVQPESALEFKDYKQLIDYLVKEYNQWLAGNKIPARTLSNADRLRMMPVAMFKVFFNNLKKKYELGEYRQVQAMAAVMLQNKNAAHLGSEINELEHLIQQCIDHQHQALSNVFVNLKGLSGHRDLNSLYDSNDIRLTVPAIEVENIAA